MGGGESSFGIGGQRGLAKGIRAQGEDYVFPAEFVDLANTQSHGCRSKKSLGILATQEAESFRRPCNRRWIRESQRYEPPPAVGPS